MKRYKLGNYYEIRDDNGGRQMEHRAIMEKHLGRKLNKDEVVHHLNENGLDNRLENLSVMTWSDHARHHAPVLPLVDCICETCGGNYTLRANKYRYKVKNSQHFYCSRRCIGLAGHASTGKLQHGTTNCYKYHKCRCSLCRGAIAEAQRNYQRKKSSLYAVV